MPKPFLNQTLSIHQGHNHGENLGSTFAMVGRICPPGWDRVKVSENLGVTAVAPVAPAVSSLYLTEVKFGYSEKATKSST